MENKSNNFTEESYHLPVMLSESIENLVLNESGIYIDGTLGGAGHAAAILQKLKSGGTLLAFDLDKYAIEHSKGKLEKYLSEDSSPKVHLYNSRFDKACSIAEQYRPCGGISGILLDLGVSSRQLDSSQIGLSYRIDSPLDMRFGTSGISAEEFLNTAEPHELERVLTEYGEESYSKLIASRIVERRRGFAMKTTFDLRMAVEEVVPEKVRFKALSRVFQAVRIVVNDELGVLEQTLECMLPQMAQEGRYVVISYHSLEDRVVKNFFKRHTTKSGNKYRYVESETKLKILTSKPLLPTSREIKENPRARSAKMRVAEVILPV